MSNYELTKNKEYKRPIQKKIVLQGIQKLKS